MNKTGIQYLDYTWNPIAMRCTRVSAGCDNCWHLKMCKRHAGNPKLGAEMRQARAGGSPVMLADELNAPRRLRKPSRIGVEFMGDLFHETIPESFFKETWDTMMDCPQHTFMLLTKRLKRAEAIIPCAMDNIWCGATVEDQDAADERIPYLLRIPAAVRFVSVEPMLGPVDLGCQCWLSLNTGPQGRCEQCGKRRWLGGGFIGWVICGAETGSGARYMDPFWAGALLYQCEQAKVPFFMKAMSKKAEIPEDLDKKEWPK